MHGEAHHNDHVDVRIVIYRSLKQFAVIIVIGFIIKYALCDTVLINTDQMEPVILKGDRVILSRAPLVAPFKWLKGFQYNDPVVFSYPQYKGKNGCLRIAGFPGDTVAVEQGSLTITNRPELTFFTKHEEEETLPAVYSPRDNMGMYRIPQIGDTIDFDSLPIRDLIFSYSIIQQENPKNRYMFKSTLLIDDSITNDYIIEDFPLYSGKFSAIPDSLYGNWFFWDRLEAFLIAGHAEQRVLLSFSLFEEQAIVDRYIIKKRFFFLLSDEWCKGYDSRYFGPVAANHIKGRVAGILWSFSPEPSGIRGLRSRRIFKIIK